jgi:hypothetical protein
MAPAVLGRESTVSRLTVRDMGAMPSLTFGGETETSEEMLPETAWPGFAVIVLDVSVDTRERGRGMNSKVSENPTLVLGPGFARFGLLGMLGCSSTAGSTGPGTDSHGAGGAHAGDGVSFSGALGVVGRADTGSIRSK